MGSAKLKILRGVAIFLPQLLILLMIGARFDLLFGFNRTDTGFTTLLFLFGLAPVMNLIWLIVEIINSVRVAKRQNRSMSFLLPGLALFFLLESLFIDIFMLSHARM
jgi:hypothetical protein